MFSTKDKRYANCIKDGQHPVTGQLADTPTRGMDDSRTGQLADATVDFACLVYVLLAACETATCPVGELTSPRDVQSASWQSASCPVTQHPIHPKEIQELSFL